MADTEIEDSPFTPDLSSLMQRATIVSSPSNQPPLPSLADLMSRAKVVSTPQAQIPDLGGTNQNAATVPPAAPAPTPVVPPVQPPSIVGGNPPVQQSFPEVAVKSAWKGTVNIAADLLNFGNVLTQVLPRIPAGGGISLNDQFRAAAQNTKDQADAVQVDAVSSYKDITGPHDLVNYAAAKIGQLTPYLAMAVAAAPEALAEGTVLTAQQVLGRFIQSSMPFAINSVGETLSQIKDETGEDHPGLALGFGAIKGILMSLPVSNFVNKTINTGSDVLWRPVWQTLIGDTITHAVSFGGISAATATVDLIAHKVADDTFELANAKNWQGVAAAAIDGAITGGLLGGVEAPVKTLGILSGRAKALAVSRQAVLSAQEQVMERKGIDSGGYAWLKSQAEKDAFDAGKQAVVDAKLVPATDTANVPTVPDAAPEAQPSPVPRVQPPETPPTVAKSATVQPPSETKAHPPEPAPVGANVAQTETPQPPIIASEAPTKAVVSPSISKPEPKGSSAKSIISHVGEIEPLVKPAEEGTYQVPATYSKGDTVGLKSGGEGTIVRKLGGSLFVKTSYGKTQKVTADALVGRRATSEQEGVSELTPAQEKWYTANLDAAKAIARDHANGRIPNADTEDTAVEKMAELAGKVSAKTKSLDAPVEGEEPPKSPFATAIRNAVEDAVRKDRAQKRGGPKVSLEQHVEETGNTPTAEEPRQKVSLDKAIENLLDDGSITQKEHDYMLAIEKGDATRDVNNFGITPKEHSDLMRKMSLLINPDDVGSFINRFDGGWNKRDMPASLLNFVGRKITSKGEFLRALTELDKYDPRTAALTRRLVEALPDKWFKSFSTIFTLGGKGDVVNGAFSQLERVARAAINHEDPSKIVHEIYHAITTGLTPDERTQIEVLRKQAIDNDPTIPTDVKELLKSGISSRDFESTQLPNQAYHLANADEFFVHEMIAALQRRPTSLPEKLMHYASEMFKAIVNAVKEFLGKEVSETPEWSSYFDFLQKRFESGYFNPATDRGLIDARNQEVQSRVKSADELKNREFFGEKDEALIARAAHTDYNRIYSEEATRLGVPDRVRQRMGLDASDEIIAAANSGAPTIHSFRDAWDAVKNNSLGAQTRVILDTLSQILHVQRQRIDARQQRDVMEAELSGPKGWQRLSRLADLAAKRDRWEDAANDFEQQVSASAGRVLADAKAKGETSAEYARALSDYRRLMEMKNFSNAVAQRVENMVNTIAASEEGRNALFAPFIGKGADASLFAKIYEDLRRTTGDPVTHPDEHVFVRLAASVIATDHDLALRLASLKLAKEMAGFKSQVDAFGARFRSLLANDPAKAVQFLMERMRNRQDKATRAEIAWMALNREMTAECRNLADLNDMVAIHTASEARPDWRSLVTEVGRLASPVDRSAIRPDAVVEKDGNKLYNEFTSKQELIGPSGRRYDLDFGLNKASADGAWREIGDFCKEVGVWLYNQDALPAGTRSPEYDYWKRQRDFAESMFYTDRLTNPLAINSVLTVWKKSLMLQPDVELQRIQLPGSKLATSALNNLVSSKMQTDGWYRTFKDQVLNRLAKAALERKLPLDEYQDKVLTQMAWLAGNGERLNPGVELDNGIVITKTDIDALKMMARAINALETMVKNTGREKVMTGSVLEHREEDIWALRRPMERGFEANTTLPRIFSDDGRRLATLIHGLSSESDIISALDQPNFQRYMPSFVAQRKAAFVRERSPFEESYKELAKLNRSNDPAAPKCFQDYVDYIAAHAGSSDWDADSIRTQLVKEIKGRMDSFYEAHLKESEPDDATFFRTAKDSALTRGRDSDDENSFFYDYGVNSEPQLRGLALDANNAHFVRLDLSLRSLKRDIEAALVARANAPDDAAFMKAQRAAFRSGDDFRDYDYLLRQKQVVDDLISTLPKAAGDISAEANLSRSLQGPTGMIVKGAMSGVRTAFRIVTGSAAKQGVMFSAMDKGLMWATGKAMASMAMAVSRVGVPAGVGLIRAIPDVLLKGPAEGIKSRREGMRVAVAKALEKAMEHIGDDMVAPTRELMQQRMLGLIPEFHLNEAVANRILMAETGGMGFDKERPYDSGSVKTACRMLLQGTLGFGDFMSVYMPGVAYNIAYQAVAKQALNTIGVLEANARRTFAIHEKMGTLGHFDLENPGNPANRDLMHASELLPRGLAPKMQTQLDLTRAWFDHLDLPYTTAVLTFWKRLQNTASADRKNVHLLSADLATGSPEAKYTEDKRSAVLAASALENIHHASIGNRPWRTIDSPLLKWFNPFLGWTTQTVNQWLTNMTGLSPRDSKYSRVAMMGIMAAGLAAYATVAAPVGYTAETLLQTIADWINKEQSGQKLPWIGDKEPTSRNWAELSKTFLSAQFFQIPGIATMANMLLGVQSGRGGMNAEPFVLGQFHSLMGLASGMIATHDPDYGLAAFMGRTVGALKPIVNRLESREGNQDAHNVSSLVRNNIAPELERQSDSSAAPSRKTPLSPVIDVMANAAFRGDMQAFQAAQAQAIQVARDMGIANPERAVQQAFASRDPISSALASKPTPEQYEQFLDRLSDSDRQLVETTYGNFQQAAQSIGINHQPFYESGGPSTGGSGGGGGASGSLNAGATGGTGGAGGLGPTGTGSPVLGASKGSRGISGKPRGLKAVGVHRMRGLRLRGPSASVGTRGLSHTRRGVRFHA